MVPLLNKETWSSVIRTEGFGNLVIRHVLMHCTDKDLK